MKHTPGPWISNYECINASNGTLLAVVQFVAIDGGPISVEEGHANSKLMSAAPDLLKALKELVNRCDGEEGVTADGSNIQTILAHAAIAKAEGNTNE